VRSRSDHLSARDRCRQVRGHACQQCGAPPVGGVGMTAAVLMPSRPEGRAEDGFGATGSGEWPPLGSRSVTYAKVVIAGGFGVGKTTFVASASQVPPARTEVVLSAT